MSLYSIGTVQDSSPTPSPAVSVGQLCHSPERRDVSPPPLPPRAAHWTSSAPLPWPCSPSSSFWGRSSPSYLNLPPAMAAHPEGVSSSAITSPLLSSPKPSPNPSRCLPKTPPTSASALFPMLKIHAMGFVPLKSFPGGLTKPG